MTFGDDFFPINFESLTRPSKPTKQCWMPRIGIRTEEGQMILSRSRAVRPRRGLVGGGGHRGTRVTDSSAAGAGRVFRNSIPPSKQTSEQPARKHVWRCTCFGYFYSVGRQKPRTCRTSSSGRASDPAPRSHFNHSAVRDVAFARPRATSALAAVINQGLHGSNICDLN